MIFATVGTQIPFDRLIEILDRIAPELNEEIIAQTSPEAQYTPKNIKTVDFLAPQEFSKIFNSATLVVAHAGMGTILSAMTAAKPIIIFPRKAALGEHRNDHQLATVRQLGQQNAVAVAYDEAELRHMLLSGDDFTPKRISDKASPELTKAIIDFIG